MNYAPYRRQAYIVALSLPMRGYEPLGLIVPRRVTRVISPHEGL